MYTAHYTKPIATPYLFNVGSTEATTDEFTCHVTQLRCRGAADDFSVAIKIGTYTDMVNAGNIYRMLQMGKEIIESSLTLLAQEAAVHRYLHHSILYRQCAHLFIGEVARMVT